MSNRDSIGECVTCVTVRHSTGGKTDHRRAAATAHQRAWRARRRAGQACYVVAVDVTVIDLLIHLSWLRDDQATDKRQVSRAIAELLADTARKIL
jgi:hypothetical protein